ncbi:MAG: hypothetical protein AAGD01_10410 [Acidobacteriota bacterium]
MIHLHISRFAPNPISIAPSLSAPRASIEHRLVSALEDLPIHSLLAWFCPEELGRSSVQGIDRGALSTSPTPSAPVLPVAVSMAASVAFLLAAIRQLSFRFSKVRLPKLAERFTALDDQAAVTARLGFHLPPFPLSTAFGPISFPAKMPAP